MTNCQKIGLNTAFIEYIYKFYGNTDPLFKLDQFGFIRTQYNKFANTFHECGILYTTMFLSQNEQATLRNFEVNLITELKY